MDKHLQWRIYYSDGTTFDNLAGGPEDAPALGVMLIAQVDVMTGRYYQSGSDFYIWLDEYERWLGVDTFGRLTYDVRPGWKRCLFGETVPNEQFRKIVKIADDDPDLPPRAGYQIRERKT